jgi:hypothetical protein
VPSAVKHFSFGRTERFYHSGRREHREDQAPESCVSAGQFE